MAIVSSVVETSIAVESVQHAEMPCDFCVSSCFSWPRKLEPGVACFFSHKETQEDTKKYEERAADVAGRLSETAGRDVSSDRTSEA